MSPKSASRDKQAIRRLICKIIALILIPIIVFFAISYIESLSDRQIADLLEIFNFSKFGIPFNSALTVFLLLLFGLFAFFPLIRLIQNFFSALTGKYFVISLATLAVLGAVAALYIPSYTNWFKPDTQQSTGGTQPTQNGQGSGNQQNQPSKDPSSDLRLHLLYITGGIIAVLGLIETNRKNSQDHIRQVHAARRDRYIEAVDKLSSKQAPVRLGGVYALVGLVDEWLDDGNIDEETQIEEGQIIINNLCAYIRSPFPLAEKIEEYEAHEELVRLQKTEPEKLNKEESLQLQVLLKRFENTNDYKKPKDITTAYAKFREEQNVRRTIFVEMSKRSSPFTKDEKGKIIETTPGYWSDFWFDFSQAPIFYPLERLIIEDGSFAHIKFYADASFFETIFIRAADFSNAEFADTATFRWATFADTAKFSGAKFNGANFSDVDFSSDTYFGGVTFTRKAIFVRATFSGIAHFSGAAFSGIANFSEATFTGNAVFVGATFTGTTNFGEANFISSAPKFNDIHKRTKFSARTSPNKYIFTVAPGTITIERKPATLLGKTFMIPYGSVLFDPRSLDKKTGEYTRVSDPAQ